MVSLNKVLEKTKMFFVFNSDKANFKQARKACLKYLNS